MIRYPSEALALAVLFSFLALTGVAFFQFVRTMPPSEYCPQCEVCK